MWETSAIQWPGKQGKLPDDLWALKQMPEVPHA